MYNINTSLRDRRGQTKSRKFYKNVQKCRFILNFITIFEILVMITFKWVQTWLVLVLNQCQNWRWYLRTFWEKLAPKLVNHVWYSHLHTRRRQRISNLYDKHLILQPWHYRLGGIFLHAYTDMEMRSGGKSIISVLARQIGSYYTPICRLIFSSMPTFFLLFPRAPTKKKITNLIASELI